VNSNQIIQSYIIFCEEHDQPTLVLKTLTHMLLICVSKFKQKNAKGYCIFHFGKVMFMCMLSLTLDPLSATSGEHGMLHPTQLVLLDPMHNNDALVSFFSTLKQPLSILLPFFFISP